MKIAIHSITEHGLRSTHPLEDEALSSVQGSYEIAVVGDPGVGKSELIHRVLNPHGPRLPQDTFLLTLLQFIHAKSPRPENHDAQKESNLILVDFSGEEYLLSIVEIPGSHTDLPLLNFELEDVDGIMLVHASHHKESLGSVLRVLETNQNLKKNSITMCLVEAKHDAGDADNRLDPQESTQQMREPLCFGVSARDSQQSVDDAFLGLVKAIHGSKALERRFTSTINCVQRKLYGNATVIFLLWLGGSFLLPKTLFIYSFVTQIVVLSVIYHRRSLEKKRERMLQDHKET